MGTSFKFRCANDNSNFVMEDLMKKIALALCLAGLVVGVAGCSGKKGDGAATCREASANFIAVSKAEIIDTIEKKTGEKMDAAKKDATWAAMAAQGGLPADPGRQLGFLEAACSSRGDSPDMRNCGARAKTMDELTACQTLYLKK